MNAVVGHIIHVFAKSASIMKKNTATVVGLLIPGLSIYWTIRISVKFLALLLEKCRLVRIKSVKNWAQPIAMDSARITREIKSRTPFSPSLSNSWFAIRGMKTRKNGDPYFIV
jgi:hypothetical protein